MGIIAEKQATHKTSAPAGNRPSREIYAPLLHKRGIYDTARAAGFQEVRGGWEYPVIDLSGRELARRFKNATSEGSKYYWRTDKGDAVYYFADPKNFLAAIEAQQGRVYIANGEPAALAIRAAGQANVFSWFGEKSVPDTLADDLLAWGVSEAVYIPDHDDTGRASAADVRYQLEQAGITLRLLAWGNRPEKYDANDLWIDCQFVPAAFWQAIGALDALILPRETRQPQTVYDGPPLEADASLISQLAQRLGVAGRGRSANGYMTGKRIANPIDPHPHDQQRPASAFNFDNGGLKDQRSGNFYSAWELAKFYGIDTSAYRQQAHQRRETMPEHAGTLPDDTARWEAMPPVNLGEWLATAEQRHEITTVTPNDTKSNQAEPDQSDGLAQGVWLGLQAWLPKNAAALAKAIDDAGANDQWLTIPEIAALPTIEALGLTTDQLYAFAEKPAMCQLMGIFSIEANDPQTELMGNFYTIESKDSMEKKPTNSAGRPAGTYYRLKTNDELRAVIRREARQQAVLSTAQYDGKALPLDWTPEQIADLPGAISDATTSEALQLATQAAKEADADFADDLRLYDKRTSELLKYVDRELDNEDPAALYPIDPDLLGKGSAHNVMAAQAHRYYHEREPNRTGDTWLFAALCGVSRPTLKKVREIARLKYAADTRESIELAPDQPEVIAREINRLARSRGGRALYISAPGHAPVPVRRENLPSVIACAARNDTKLRVELSVSQPLERYTPTAEQLAAEQVQRESKPYHETALTEEVERKPRQPKAERRDLYLQSFRRIPAALGWTFDGTAWMHPDDSGTLYPDHAPTLLKAITDLLGHSLEVAGAMGPLAEVETFEVKTLEVAPPPAAPVVQKLHDPQPADWWVNFQAVMYPRNRRTA